MKLWFLSSMSMAAMLLMLLLIDEPKQAIAQQEPIFELPVQLVGFPVIILAVRLSNFVKKLSYSLSPQTYQTRSRRSTQWQIDPDFMNISKEAIDISSAEKQILTELGPKACVLEEPCRFHAGRHRTNGEQPDWSNILRNYKNQSSGMKQWYLLSVFLGDVIRDVPLCKKLAKRLRCDRDEKVFVRD
ncbi:hypothetical protein HA402_003963 [Bradysia odoriphaga]|nr:hypothetical protein HA402_003963 [Bradysia odoriphaga]